MINDQPKNKDFEQIDIDNRDRILTNEQIDLELEKIFDEKTPYFNHFGFEQNINSRFDNYCQIVSYYTDESKLDATISHFEQLFQTTELSTEIGNYLKKIRTESYSLNDSTKIKAIFFSKRAEFYLFKRSFAVSDPDIHIPEFQYNLANRVFTHNLPLIYDITSRNVDLKEEKYLLNLPEQEAIIYINENIRILQALDHQHRKNISSEKIEFYKKIRKLISSNRKVKTQPLPQQNDKTERHQSKKELYSNIFKGNAFEVWQFMFDEFEITEKSRTDVKFIFEEMKKDGLIHSTVNQTAFLGWIASYTDGLIISKTSNHSRTKVRLSTYSRAKKIYKEDLDT